MTRYAPLWQQAGTYPSQLDRQLLGALWPGGGASGGAIAAVANTMNLSIAPGSAGVPLQTGQGTALCRWDAAEVLTLDAAPPSGQDRWDLVVCQVRDTDLDAGPNNDFILTVVKGTPAASNPAVPATPPNALALANVVVTGGAANLTAAQKWDQRGWRLAFEPWRGTSDVVWRNGWSGNAGTGPNPFGFRKTGEPPSICVAFPMWTASPVLFCILLEGYRATGQLTIVAV